MKMKISKNVIKLPDECSNCGKNNTGVFSESEFINNLMLNPAKYREFKRNINRINNIDNEINYLKAKEQKNRIDFVNSIIINEKDYETALQESENLYENLTDVQIIDLLSHKKLLSNEKHLVEAMAYFIGVENLDWNTFKLSFNLYEAKSKMKNIDYSKISKKKINILLSQLCRADTIENFLSRNDFGDSGMEFVYEWVKCQMKIYFYLYQNKKIPVLKTHTKTNTHLSLKKEISENKNKKFSKVNFNNTANENKVFKRFLSVDNTKHPNNFTTSRIPENNFGYYTTPLTSNAFEQNLLVTAVPIVSPGQNTDEQFYNNIRWKNYERDQKKIFRPVEVQKVDLKLKGHNVYKDRIFREIRTAELLPLLKNKTYHQMRDFFDEKIPLSKEIEKQHKKDVNNYSLNGKKNERKLMTMIASGKVEVMNYLSLFKLKQILGN